MLNTPCDFINLIFICRPSTECCVVKIGFLLLITTAKYYCLIMLINNHHWRYLVLMLSIILKYTRLVPYPRSLYTTHMSDNKQQTLLFQWLLSPFFLSPPYFAQLYSEWTAPSIECISVNVTIMADLLHWLVWKNRIFTRNYKQNH